MCWKCKQEIKLETITRTSECPECKTDLHSCKNCFNYSPESHYECHETIEDPIFDKEKANFCDSFKVRRVFSTNQTNKQLEAKKAFDALFS